MFGLGQDWVKGGKTVTAAVREGCGGGNHQSVHCHRKRNEDGKELPPTPSIEQNQKAATKPKSATSAIRESARLRQARGRTRNRSRPPIRDKAAATAAATKSAESLKRSRYQAESDSGTESSHPNF